MRIRYHFRQARAKAIAVVALCLIAAMLTPAASAEPAIDGASSCGSFGSSTDGAGGGPAPTEPLDDSTGPTNGAVEQVAENTAYDDSALEILDELTELLDQSDSDAPAIVEGRLESDCSVAFILEGTHKQVGTVGMTGLQINENSRYKLVS